MAAENKKDLYEKDHFIFIWFHLRSSYMICFLYIYQDTIMLVPKKEQEHLLAMNWHPTP